MYFRSYNLRLSDYEPFPPHKWKSNILRVTNRNCKIVNWKSNLSNDVLNPLMYFFFPDSSITLRELHPPPISRLPVNWPTLVSHGILKNLSIFTSWTVTNRYYDSIVYVILLSMKLRNIEQNQSYCRFIFIKLSWIYWTWISRIKLYI